MLRSKYCATLNLEEQIFWDEFLELYKSMPSLWKVKTSDYCNRELKNECYKKMVEKLKEVDPDANREKVVKKINIFRTNFKRDLKKRKSNESKGGAHNVSKSTLWYFDKLKFLEEPACSKEKGCSMDTGSYNIPIKTEKRKIISETVVNKKPIRKSPSEVHEDSLSQWTERDEDDTYEDDSACPYRKFSDEEKRSEIIMQKKPLRETTAEVCVDNLSHRKEKDEADIYGEAWAWSYRKLSPEQKLFAKKACDEIFVLGQLKQLTLNSVITNVLYD